MKFDNKIIWITGASSGIGEALAYQLAKQNCKLILSSRNKAQLLQVKANCVGNENIQVLPLDLVDFDTMSKHVTEAIKLFGKIDMLINNGGISQRSLVANTNFDVYKKLMDVNYLGPVALSLALLPHFIENQNGHFVTVTSVMGKFSSPYRSGYCGAKHALHGFFDSLRMEHEKDGINVTLVCPGFVNTNIAQSALTGSGATLKKQDQATQNGLEVNYFARKMIKAIKRKKFETYIGKKEVLGVYLRIFPRLLHRVVLHSTVR